MTAYIENESAVLLLGALPRSKDKTRITAVLTIREGLWVCGSAFLEGHIPTYSQRISEMVRDGADIERGTCTNSRHTHRSKMGAYRWRPAEEGTQESLEM